MTMIETTDVGHVWQILLISQNPAGNHTLHETQLFLKPPLKRESSRQGAGRGHNSSELNRPCKLPGTTQVGVNFQNGESEAPSSGEVDWIVGFADHEAVERESLKGSAVSH